VRPPNSKEFGTLVFLDLDPLITSRSAQSHRVGQDRRKTFRKLAATEGRSEERPQLWEQ